MTKIALKNDKTCKRRRCMKNDSNTPPFKFASGEEPETPVRSSRYVGQQVNQALMFNLIKRLTKVDNTRPVAVPWLQVSNS